MRLAKKVTNAAVELKLDELGCSGNYIGLAEKAAG